MAPTMVAAPTSRIDAETAAPRARLRPGSSANAFSGHTTKSGDRKSTRLNSSHVRTSYAVFCLKKKTNERLRLHYRSSTGPPALRYCQVDTHGCEDRLESPPPHIGHRQATQDSAPILLQQPSET